NQLAKGNAESVISAKGAIAKPELQLGYVETRRCQTKQHNANLRRSVLNRRGAVLHRLTARGISLVRRSARIRGDELDASGLDDKLFGRNLDQRGFDALSELRLAGEHSDAAIGIHAYPRIEHRRVFQ